jgi:hypothetical protein
LFVGERPLSVESPPQIIHSLSNFRERYLVFSPNPGQNERFDEVDEGELAPLPIGDIDNGLEQLCLSRKRIPLAKEPSPQSGNRDTKIPRSLGDAVGRNFPHVPLSRNVSRFGHHSGPYITAKFV